MKINDTGMKDVQRPTVTEKEIAKMKELSVAPVKSDTSDTQKVKLTETREMISGRLAQQRETQVKSAEAKKTVESGKAGDKLSGNELVSADSKLNRGGDVSFKANGPCEKLCLKVKVETGYRY